MKGIVSSEVDFISNLPHSIIDNILGFLDLRDIVRTSILSREWRHKWLSCPDIVFNETRVGCHKPKPRFDQILERHQGLLLKFVLIVPWTGVRPDVNEWLHLLPNHYLQHLNLRVPPGRGHELTSHLFSFQNLRHLKLEDCVLRPPPGFKGFPKLVSLDLRNCLLVDETFGNFVSLCAMVEEVCLCTCANFDCLEITGPKLKSFVSIGCFDSISFKNCPVLGNVTMSARYGSFSFDSIKGLIHLPSLEELKLFLSAFGDLVEFGAPNKRPIALKTLKKLHLSGNVIVNTEEISSAICFIQSCPNLQRLEINAFLFEVGESVADFLRLLNMKRPKPLTHLKIVKMELYYGNDCEIEFLKYFLASATALEEMLVVADVDSVIAGGESILNELKQYPRASQRAEIKYKQSI